ncbi:hypothetical protein CCHR01_19056 [Colletotrichum chrysophilum]|uniref:Uncharacterized protein n=1 Tax=Colletotrichum chrysophilum TaxID=1836956 RepID=A0AAD8ZZ61_9PEZI|nr:hypothetical protein CCHR01_19056 [Colletotrichum chrysophilum]
MPEAPHVDCAPPSKQSSCLAGLDEAGFCDGSPPHHRHGTTGRWNSDGQSFAEFAGRSRKRNCINTLDKDRDFRARLPIKDGAVETWELGWGQLLIGGRTGHTKRHLTSASATD